MPDETKSPPVATTNVAPAAKAAPPAPPAPAVSETAGLDPLEPGYVYVRITKKGHGVVHTGGSPKTVVKDTGAQVFEGDKIFPTFAKGAIVPLPLSVAKAQEANYNVEILD